MEDYNYETISNAICSKWLGKTIIYQQALPSTNDLVKTNAMNGAEQGLLVIADCQFAGRGSKGRSWVSPSGTGIWMSYLTRPDIEIHKACEVTLLASYCIVKVLRNEFEIQAAVKWPNDVILNGKKIAGILTEVCRDDQGKYCLITGIGINVNQESFPEELQNASSINLEIGSKLSRTDLLSKIIQCIEETYEQYLKEKSLDFILEAYNQYLVHRNQKVRILNENEEMEATSIGINMHGKLEVELDNGQRLFIGTGEVSLRGVYGYV